MSALCYFFRLIPVGFICYVTTFDSTGQSLSVVDEEQNILHHAKVFVGDVPNSDLDSILNRDFKLFDLNDLQDIQEVYWLRFSIENNTNKEIEMLTSSFFIDSLSVYVLEDKRLVKQPGRHGYLIPTDERAHRYGQSAIIPINVPEQGVTEYFIRVHNYSYHGKQFAKTSFRMGFVLYSLEGFHNRYDLLVFFNHFLTGLFTLTILFNILMLAWVRERIFGYLLLHNLACYSWILFTGGVLINLGLIEDLELERTLRTNVPYILFHVSYPVFIVAFLKIKKYSRPLHLAMIGLPIIYFIVTIPWVLDYETTVVIREVISLTLYMLVPISAFLGMRNNQEFAAYIFLGSLVLLINTIVYVHFFNRPEFNYQTGHVIFLIGLTFETLVFTFATTQIIGVLKMSNIKVNAEKRAVEKELEEKNRKLIAYTTSRMRNNEELEEIQKELGQENNRDPRLEKRLDQLKHFDAGWDTFKVYFENVYSEFFEVLNARHTNLTSNEERLAAFIKMGLTSKEIAGLQNVTKRAVDKARERLKKKMELSPEVHLNDHIKNL